jgi:hypothetical protein
VRQEISGEGAARRRARWRGCYRDRSVEKASSGQIGGDIGGQATAAGRDLAPPGEIMDRVSGRGEK